MAFLRTSPHSFTHAKGSIPLETSRSNEKPPRSVPTYSTKSLTGFPLRLCSGLTLRQFDKLTTSKAQGKTLEKGFTLVELLIVIGILAILSVAVVVVLNPAELIKQSRDSSRMSDFAAISTAMSLYTIDQPGGFTGSSSIVYVSIPDTSNTCANLGLPTLPTGYSYACSSTSTYRKVDGTGWMPLSLSSMATGAPFSVLPIDPVNTTSSGNYYTYTPSGQKYEVATPFESAKYKLGGSADRASMDGGIYTGLYESGSSLSLIPIDYGDPSLVGYWTFNEGSGTKAYDYSGHNASGTLACAGSGCTNPSWVSGRVGSNALSINPLLSSSSYVSVPIINNPSVSGNALSISIWINPSVSQSKGGWLLRNGGGIDENYGFYLGSPSGGNYKMNIEGYSGGFRNAGTTSYIIPTSVWSHIVLVFTQGLSFQVYLNGALQQTVNFPYVTAISTSAFYIGGNANSAVQNLDGSMDDVRIYNRALSASEILALYNATK